MENVHNEIRFQDPLSIRTNVDFVDCHLFKIQFYLNS